MSQLNTEFSDEENHPPKRRRSNFSQGTPNDKNGMQESHSAHASIMRPIGEIPFKKLSVVGEGTYGVVYKAVHQETGKLAALKKLRVDNEDEGIPGTALREISILRELRHKNIVPLLGIHYELKKGKKPVQFQNKDSTPLQDGNMYLEFEYCDLDLRKLMKTFPLRRIPIPIVKKFSRQLLEALDYCHRKRVLHRDLKPSNILVKVSSEKSKLPAANNSQRILTVPGEEDYDLMIADFGLARKFGAVRHKPLTREVVTLWYRPPEILLGLHSYSPAVDVWSVGCIIFELLYGRAIFNGDSEVDTLFKIFQLYGTPTKELASSLWNLPYVEEAWPRWQKSGNRYSWMSEVIEEKAEEEEIKNLIDILLSYNPENRPTAGEALQHKWFNRK
eukprot:GHVP01053806.1.p2 GENE.GHVP01053806.1~~GHVP01053806.1.p2  ORF type:complete len:389 (+),score=65.46 GHVP01053806.1:1321-2487(+)